MKKYKIYNIDEADTNYSVCLEHPVNPGFTLCGDTVDNTPDFKKRETDEKINCEYCLKTIKVIKEIQGNIFQEQKIDL